MDRLRGSWSRKGNCLLDKWEASFHLILQLSWSGRVLVVNGMDIITQAVIEAAQESLVIGRA